MHNHNSSPIQVPPLLPIGFKCSHDIVQVVIDVADLYIDDIGRFSSPQEDHIETFLLSTIFHHFGDNGFTINPLICE